MKPDLEENQLRQLFHELKQEDERHTPLFGRTWQSATSRADHPHEAAMLWRVVVATAALIIVATSMTLFHLHSNSAPRESSTAQTALLITQWQSPTDFLLTATSAADNAQSTTQSNQ